MGAQRHCGRLIVLASPTPARARSGCFHQAKDSEGEGQEHSKGRNHRSAGQATPSALHAAESRACQDHTDLAEQLVDDGGRALPDRGSGQGGDLMKDRCGPFIRIIAVVHLAFISFILHSCSCFLYACPFILISSLFILMIQGRACLIQCL